MNGSAFFRPSGPDHRLACLFLVEPQSVFFGVPNLDPGPYRPIPAHTHITIIIVITTIFILAMFRLL